MPPNLDALLTLVAGLQDATPETFDISEYEDWISDIVSPQYLASKAKAVRWTAAVAIVELLGLCSPWPPWDDEQLRAVFELFISILDESAEPVGHHSRRSSEDAIDADDSDLLVTVQTVYQELESTGAHALLSKLDGSDELLELLFAAAFRAAHVAKSIELLQAVGSVLVAIVSSELFELDSATVAMILDQLQGPAASFSAPLANGLGKHIGAYFEELLGSEGPKRFAQATSIGLALVEWCPAAIEPYRSLFSEYFTSEEPAARLMAVKVVGAMVAASGTDPTNWASMADDRLSSIRLAWVEACTSAEPPKKVIAALMRLAMDSPVKIRAAVCQRPFLRQDLKAAEKVLAPRVRDCAEAVRTEAFESVRQLYEHHWRSPAAAWIPNAVFSALYTDLSLYYALWMVAADLFGSRDQTALRIVTTVKYCTRHSLNALDRLYKAHLSAAGAVTLFLDGTDTDVTGKWLEKICPGVSEHLDRLSDEDRMVLADLAAPTSSLEIIYAEVSSLPEPLQPLALCASYRVEDAVPGVLDLLRDPELRQAAQWLAELITRSVPRFIAQDTDKLVQLMEEVPEMTDAAVKILAPAAEHCNVSLPQDMLEQLVAKDSGDCIRLLARCAPGELEKSAPEIVDRVLESPSAAGLGVLEALQRYAPEAMPARVEKTLPKRLFKLAHNRDNSTEIRSAALEALLAKVLIIDRHDERAVWVAKPIISFLESILLQGTAGAESAADAAGSASPEADDSADTTVLATAAQLWIKLASRFPKEMDRYSLDLLVPRMSPDLAIAIVNALKENRLSYKFAVLLFLASDAAVKRVVKVALPMLLECNKSAMLTVFARVIHYLATRNSSLPEIVTVLQYSLKLLCSAETFGRLYHVACRVKQYRDVRDVPAPATDSVSISSQRIYGISELALQMLDAFRGATDWPLGDAPARLPLPASLFQGMPTAEYAQRIAEQRFLSVLGSQADIENALGTIKPAKSPGKSPAKSPARTTARAAAISTPRAAPTPRLTSDASRGSPRPLVSSNRAQPAAGTAQNRMRHGLEQASRDNLITPDLGSPQRSKRPGLVDSVAEAPVGRPRAKRARVGAGIAR